MMTVAERAISKLRTLWLGDEDLWDAQDEFDAPPTMPGMHNYPVMVVNAHSEDALATLSWVNLPAVTPYATSHAYVLSCRRI